MVGSADDTISWNNLAEIIVGSSAQYGLDPWSADGLKYNQIVQRFKKARIRLLQGWIRSLYPGVVPVPPMAQILLINGRFSALFFQPLLGF